MAKPQAKKRPVVSRQKASVVRRKPTSRITKIKNFRLRKLLTVALVFAVLFGGIGSYLLLSSRAEVIDRGTVAYMSTQPGCWLAGRVWDGSSCLKRCRSASSSFIAATSTHLGYCSGAIATAVGQTACTNYGRRFVSSTGCSRRIDNDTTAGATQCRYSNNTYYVVSGVDFCGINCSGTVLMAITTCPAAPAPTGGTTTPTSFSVWNRDSVNHTYQSLWASGAGAMQYWNGNVSTCNAGNIADGARSAMINAINFARTVNYLEPIHGAYSQGASQNLAAQQAALMMDANNQLSHNPPSSWRCYTATGADAASKSNIGLNTYTPLSAIKAFMDEPGPANYYVGHRRWLLYPDANGFGFGMTGRAVAVKVTGLTTDTTNADPLWTMWPSRGYFPSTIEPAGRWSVSTKAGVNLAFASVRVTKDGVNIPVTRYAVKNETAIRSTLVWQMPAGSNSGNYSVTISGARKSGVTQPAYTYPVYFFNPY